MKLTNKTTMILSTLFAAVTLTACGQAPMPAMQQPVRFQAQSQAAASRQLLVKFRGQFQMSRDVVAEFDAKYGIRIGNFLPALGVYVVELAPGLEVRPEKVAAYLQNDPMVEHAEVNYALQIQPVGPDVQLMPVK